MGNLTLYEMYSLYEKLSKYGSDSELEAFREHILREEKILEDTSATGGPSVSGTSNSVSFSSGVGMADASTSGMGGVYQSQPSAFPGSLNGANWVNGGGQSGSGDISVPYNPSGANRIFQKMKSPMGKNHGAKTGKKSRIKGMDLKKLRSIKRPKFNKIIDFDSFSSKELVNKVTKVKE